MRAISDETAAAIRDRNPHRDSGAGASSDSDFSPNDDTSALEERHER